MLFDPQLCRKIEEIPEPNSHIIFERKLDGGRALVSTKPKIYSRRGLDQSLKFPLIIQELKMLPEDTILDGEITVFENGISNFRYFLKRIQPENPFIIKQRIKKYPATLWIFDILRFKGQDLRDLPLRERKSLLMAWIRETEHIKVLKYYEKPDPLLKLKNVIEGIVIKDLRRRYEEGKRSGTWKKLKFVKEKTVTIVDFEDQPNGVTLVTKDGQRVVWNGLNVQEKVRKLMEKGSFKADVEYQSISETGKMRFPAFKGIA